jgi:hypothetical protein
MAATPHGCAAFKCLLTVMAMMMLKPTKRTDRGRDHAISVPVEQVDEACKVEDTTEFNEQAA